jgi:hypothetical protein
MDSGRVQQGKNAEGCRTVDGNLSTGARVRHSATRRSRWSGSILGDFSGQFISNRPRLRQTEEATLGGTKIPCPQRPYSKQHLAFLNQSVAAEKVNPRQLKSVHESPKNGEGAITTMRVFGAPLRSSVFSENPFRLEMPSRWLTPEVSKCR